MTQWILRRQLSSRRNYLKLFSNESMLWSIFQIVENWLSFIHNWSIYVVDLHRLEALFCLPSNLPVAYMSSTSHSLKSWMSSPSSQHVLNKGLNSLHQPPLVIIDCLNRTLSVNWVTTWLKAETTFGSLFSCSVNLFWEVKFIYWPDTENWTNLHPKFDGFAQWFLDLCDCPHSLSLSSHHAFPFLLWHHLWIHAQDRP